MTRAVLLRGEPSDRSRGILCLKMQAGRPNHEPLAPIEPTNEVVAVHLHEKDFG